VLRTFGPRERSRCWPFANRPGDPPARCSERGSFAPPLPGPIRTAVGDREFSKINESPTRIPSWPRTENFGPVYLTSTVVRTPRVYLNVTYVPVRRETLNRPIINITLFSSSGNIDAADRRVSIGNPGRGGRPIAVRQRNGNPNEHTYYNNPSGRS